MTDMRTLLLQLPVTPPGPHAVYGQAWIDASVAARVQVQFSGLALLPAVDRRTPVALLIPAAALSWHRITLPAGLGRNSTRLQAALQGLLEDRLLQDATQVHMALPPQWKAGEPIWVAVCDKTWLLQHLQALQDARLPVQRLVPEFAPPTQGQFWHATGKPEMGWLWHRSAEHGVSGWPVAEASQLPPSWLEGAPVLAEPGLAGWAQARCPDQVELVETASHWPTALDNGWDLAQFELAARLRQQHGLRWRQGLDGLWRHPQWRPARWGLLAVLLAQVVGLNAWAWMARQQWQAQQDSWTRMLQDSFPSVTVVLDAPVQMAREVARLRQASGQLTPVDFESQLQALGSALPADVASPNRLSYEQGLLQWPALTMSATQKAAFEQALGQRGYTLRTQGDVWGLQSQEVRP